MSDGYLLSGFTDRYDEWIEREDPSPEWQAEVLKWIIGLTRDIFDRAVYCHWDGKHGWRATVCLEGNSERLVMCAYFVYNDTRSALCWRLKFAPYYDADPVQPPFESEDF